MLLECNAQRWRQRTEQPCVRMLQNKVMQQRAPRSATAPAALRSLLLLGASGWRVHAARKRAQPLERRCTVRQRSLPTAMDRRVWEIWWQPRLQKPCHVQEKHSLTSLLQLLQPTEQASVDLECVPRWSTTTHEQGCTGEEQRSNANPPIDLK